MGTKRKPADETAGADTGATYSATGATMGAEDEGAMLGGTTGSESTENTTGSVGEGSDVIRDNEGTAATDTSGRPTPNTIQPGSGDLPVDTSGGGRTFGGAKPNR